MAVNYNDDRLVQVQKDENKATTEINKTYNDMIESSNAVYKDQIAASKEWADKQTELQNQRTDFAIEQIEQKKEEAEKDYLKEQSGAYVDWQKQSNQYGANAEAIASSGLTNTGYSESSQVSMYNTYQNRIAVARENNAKIQQNFDIAIKDAQMQNNSVLAEIAFNAYKEQAEYNLQMVAANNQLLAEKLNAKMQTQQIYHNQYQDVLQQINTENALAEQIRQYNQSLAEEKRQYDSSLALQREQFNFQKQQYADSKRASEGAITKTSSKDKSSSGRTSGGGSTTFLDSKSSDVDRYGNSKALQGKKDYYFSNGYQPRYVNNMKLSKTGDNVVVNGKTQNLWKTSDGTLWYWDGSVRLYKKASLPSSNGKAGAYAGGVASTLNQFNKKVMGG